MWWRGKVGRGGHALAPLERKDGDKRLELGLGLGLGLGFSRKCRLPGMLQVLKYAVIQRPLPPVERLQRKGGPHCVWQRNPAAVTVRPPPHRRSALQH